MKKSMSLIRGIITGASAILLVWLIRRISQEEQETQGSTPRWGGEAPAVRTRQRSVAPKRVESESEKERQPVVTAYDRPDARASEEEEAAAPTAESAMADESPVGEDWSNPMATRQATPIEEITAEALDRASLEQPLAEPRGSDDLVRIEGIGPKISSILQEVGINGFEQLANTPVKRLREILGQHGLQFSNPESWPDQARLAAAEDWQGLLDLQEQLRGGRRTE